ncbi:tripartite tricarboxylate transporter substrate binding protein [Bradyrhizobium sp. KB893862 SZCCT0404]|uniref:Bug family tripartite tricarboxylate transporter substrate binding protein n=1 Tax=Bradyrhizobium sp. KB893862 SZCCT0404 TaxID=2807672 RepID=UPI001BA4FDCF|nr:tripartite tricarboxylate transporter substrate binding protein [Bradyrhizobium sp. KB893862 SZCCT0404]
MTAARTLILLCFLLGSALPALAQSFPTHQVTIISPYQAGGTSDIIARAIAQKLAQIWSQPVIVENRPGANGTIGIRAVTRAPADGHTLLAVASSALTVNPTVFANLGYDVGRDLAPITRTGQVTNVLVVHPSVPARTVSELIAVAKARPGTLSYASQGVGSNGHLNGELFKLRTGVDLLHVPYKGSAPAVTDLIGGQVQLMFDNLPSVLEQIRAGSLRALAVTSSRRSPLLPDVPTIAESGVPGFDTSAWFAFLAARDTPEALRAALEKAVVSALADADVQHRLSAAGVDIVGDGAAALAAKITQDTIVWKDVVEAAKIKVDQ